MKQSHDVAGRLDGTIDAMKCVQYALKNGLDFPSFSKSSRWKGLVTAMGEIDWFYRYGNAVGGYQPKFSLHTTQYLQLAGIHPNKLLDLSRDAASGRVMEAVLNKFAHKIKRRG